MKCEVKKIFPKLQYFEPKQLHIYITQEMLTTFKDDKDWIKIFESLMYGYDIEIKAQSARWKRPEEPRPKKARQVQSNAVLQTWCIMNSCQNIVHSIRSTTLKLCADCAKQFVRNTQNCRKTNHGFRTIVTHQLKHQCLCMTFWLKTRS